MRLMDAEAAHGLALKFLRLGLAGRDAAPDDARLEMRLLGRRVRNPIGLAAGFDKDAVAVAPLARLGFGALEAGTVTLRPQPGNPRPRLFRLGADRAIINRMGFNNRGLDVFLRNFADRPPDMPRDILIGANIGINKDSTDAEGDYAAGAAAVARFADYIVVNVSSPNTPGLRDLQGEQRLRAILAAITQSVPVRPPLLVKLAPDLAEAAVEAAVAAAIEGGAQGLIVSNTTTARPASLRSSQRHQPGGLSGEPLRAPSTALLARVARLAAGRLDLVGVGGVASGADALAKVMAGARLVQIYTAFAFDGPALIRRIKSELLAELERHGFPTIEAAVGGAVR
jgi:dihydroorotate dehydrogenase